MVVPIVVPVHTITIPAVLVSVIIVELARAGFRVRVDEQVSVDAGPRLVVGGAARARESRKGLCIS